MACVLGISAHYHDAAAALAAGATVLASLYVSCLAAAASIAGMIAAVKAAHDVDSDRVFVTGLSAGGAMTSVMLAVYPEMFAGGAIIAGLPFGIAMGWLLARRTILVDDSVLRTQNLAIFL